MATASIGKVVKLNDEMADVMAEAFKKPYKRVKVEEGLIDSKVDPKLIAKLKKM